MLDKLLRSVYRLVRYRAYWVIGVFLIIVVLALTYIFPFPIRSSLLDLLPQNDPLIERYKEREETINSTQNLNVVLSLKNPANLEPSEREARLLQLAGSIKPLLEELEEIRSVSYRRKGTIPEDYEFLYSLNSETIGEIKQTRRDLRQLLPGSGSETPELDTRDPYGDLLDRLNQLESGSAGTEEEPARPVDRADREQETPPAEREA